MVLRVLSFVILVAIPISQCLALPYQQKMSSENRAALSILRDEIRTWVQYCDGAMDYGVGCNQGDLVLFAGLLCLSGEVGRCDDVRRSQAGDGSWHRAPKRLGDSGRYQFSRDQTMGLLAYFLATKDKDGASRWIDWIYRNGREAPSSTNPIWRGCLPAALTFYSLCRDDFHFDCLVTPQLWGLIGRVWLWMGLDLTSQMKRAVEKNRDDLTIEIEAKIADRGYEKHLTAIHVLLNRFIGRNAQAVNRAAEVLAGRHPYNPLFRFVASGPNDEVAKLVLAQCPKRPLVEAPNDWLMISNVLPPVPFVTSMGWDCIFLINLLIGERTT